MNGESLVQDLSDAAEQAYARRDWQSMSGLVDEILEIDPGNLNAKFLLTMLEQNWRQIQRLIIDAQQAVNHLNWQTVLRLA